MEFLTGIVTNPFFALSGWIIGLISLLLAYRCKKKNKKLKLNITNNSRNINTKDKSNYIESNKGNLNIDQRG